MDSHGSTIMISSPHGSPVILVFWRQISSPYIPTAWPSNSRSNTSEVGIKTACIKLYRKRWVIYGESYYRPLIATHIRVFDWYHVRWPWMTFEGHFSQYVVIPTSSVSEIDTSTETELANNKSHDSFQVMWLSMTLAIFQGYQTVSHQISRKRCVIRQKLGYCRVLIGNHTLAFDWCHLWWPWRPFEGHFSLCYHFRVHLSNLAGFRVARSLSNSWASCNLLVVRCF